MRFNHGKTWGTRMYKGGIMGFLVECNKSGWFKGTSRGNHVFAFKFGEFPADIPWNPIQWYDGISPKQPMCDSRLKISLWPTFCGLFLHDLAWKMTTFAASNVGFGRAQRTDVPDIAAVSHLHSAPHLYENWCFSDPRHASTHRESQVFFCKCLIHFLTNRSIDIYSL